MMSVRKNGAKRVDKTRDGQQSLPAGLSQVNLNAAGIDVGASSHFVAVPKDRWEPSVREVDAYTADLYRLADWLAECGINNVAMESTGVYWIPLFGVLEERGFEVMLVDPRRIKNVPGRKTDVLDCQWLQQLHTFGLLSGAFRPDGEVRRLRSYGHFASWLGLSPNNRVTGGRVISSRTKPSANRAANALRLAANGLHRSDSALGAFLRRKKTHLGAPKAITATAHKLARIIYATLKYGQEYSDAGAEYYETQYRQRVLRTAKRRAAQLGYQLVPLAGDQSLALLPSPTAAVAGAD